MELSPTSVQQEFRKCDRGNDFDQYGIHISKEFWSSSDHLFYDLNEVRGFFIVEMSEGPFGRDLDFHYDQFQDAEMSQEYFYISLTTDFDNFCGIYGAWKTWMIERGSRFDVEESLSELAR